GYFRGRNRVQLGICGPVGLLRTEYLVSQVPAFEVQPAVSPLTEILNALFLRDRCQQTVLVVSTRIRQPRPVADDVYILNAACHIVLIGFGLGPDQVHFSEAEDDLIFSRCTRGGDEVVFRLAEM